MSDFKFVRALARTMRKSQWTVSDCGRLRTTRGQWSFTQDHCPITQVIWCEFGVNYPVIAAHRAAMIHLGMASELAGGIMTAADLTTFYLYLHPATALRHARLRRILLRAAGYKPVTRKEDTPGCRDGKITVEPG